VIIVFSLIWSLLLYLA